MVMDPYERDCVRRHDARGGIGGAVHLLTAKHGCVGRCAAILEQGPLHPAIGERGFAEDPHGDRTWWLPLSCRVLVEAT